MDYTSEIIKATKTILSNATVLAFITTGDRIYQSDTPLSDIPLMHITVAFDSGQGEGNLPIEHGMLKIRVWDGKDKLSSRSNVRGCSAAAIELLNRKSEAFYAANNNVRCRICDKDFDQYLIDDKSATFHSYIVFDMRFFRNI